MKTMARPTEDILREAGWTYEPAKSDGMPDYWRDPETGYIREPDEALRLVNERKRQPAPRPTCGTCPLWEPPALSNLPTGHEDSGECRLMPVVNHHFRYQWCGEHPDMPAWIRDEWPKVRAGR